MIRSQFVRKQDEKHSHLPFPVVEAAVDAILNEIIDHLAQGHRVEIRKFGNFTSKTRDARMGRNPRTGKPVLLERRRLMRFKAGNYLLGRLNGQDD